jgi:hypothetical protein
MTMLDLIALESAMSISSGKQSRAWTAQQRLILKFLNTMVNKKIISNDSTIVYGTQRRSKTIALNFRIFKRFHDYQKSYEAIDSFVQNGP